MNQFIQSTTKNSMGNNVPTVINVNNIAYARENANGTFIVFNATAESSDLYVVISMPYSEFVDKVTKA